MRIVDALATYIQNHSTVVITDVDTFYTDASERFMLLQDPAQAVESRYMDGSRVGQFAYSMYAKSLNAQTAVSDLYELEKLLDLPHGLQLESGIQIVKNVLITSAHFVTKTDKNEKIYTSSFLLDYYMEG